MSRIPMIHYQSLPSVNEDEDSEDVLPSTSKVSRPSILHDRLLYWTSILTLITTMLSCGLVIASHLRPTPIPVDAPRVLRRPSPYVNPDKLREAARLHNATFPPIVNNGPSAFQMRAGDVKRAITEDASRQWTSSIGTVWPEDRHFVVSSNTSTVFQFRNRDFDMERCVLVASLPAQTDTFDPAAHVHSGSSIDVWALGDGSVELLPSISWGTALPRRERMASFVFDTAPGAKWTSAEWHCPSGDFSTFEFACSAGQTECSVDFWQNKDKPAAGIYIVQSQSS